LVERLSLERMGTCLRVALEKRARDSSESDAREFRHRRVATRVADALMAAHCVRWNAGCHAGKAPNSTPVASFRGLLPSVFMTHNVFLSPK